LTFIERYFDEPANGNLLLATRTAVISPAGKHIYALALVDDAVTVFTRNMVTGTLTYSTAYQDGVGGVDVLDGAIDMAFSSDGKFAYVAGRDEDALAVFSRNDTTGALSFLEVHKNGIAGVVALDFVQFLVMSHD